MKDLQLATAIEEIRDTKKTHEGTWPYFFIVGAGISVKNGDGPGIPLAREIVEYCEQRARDENRKLAPANASLADRYMYYLEEVLYDATKRQDYLAELIEPGGKRQKIPLANTLLAQILLDRQTPFVVTTTNFDDFLLRALLLFDARPVIVEHAQAAGRVDATNSEIQVVHVHGTFRHYEMKNTQDEITSAAAMGDDRGVRMRDALDGLLKKHSPLVIGYSGWEKDVVMRALKRRLDNQGVPHNVYWFCYRRSDKDLLPDWLRNHEHVKFVLPEEPQHTQLDSPHRAESPALVQPMEPEGLHEEEREPSLAAIHVFRTMMDKCGIQQATLLQDPLGHFAERLREALSVAEDNVLQDVIRQVERAAELYRAEMDRNDVTRRDQLLNELNAASTEGNVEAVIKKSRELLKEGNALEPDVLSLIAETTFKLGSTLDDNTEDELACYAAAIDAARIWKQRNLPEAGMALLCGLKAQIYAGSTHMKRRKWDLAVQAFTAAVEHFKNYPALDFRQRVVRATLWRGLAYLYARDPRRAVQALGQTIKDYGKDPRPEISELVALARYNRGVAFAHSGDLKKANDDYRGVMKDFARHGSPMAVITVGKAWINSAMIRAESGFPEDAAGILKDFIRVYSERVATAESVPTTVAAEGEMLVPEADERKTTAPFVDVLRGLLERAQELLTTYERMMNDAAE